MVSVLLDVRRARQRRTTLVLLTAAGLALPIIAWSAPSLRALLATPSSVGVVMAGLSVLLACVSAVWSGREAQWTLTDDIAWAFALLTFALLGGVSATAMPAILALHGLAVVLLGVRVPPGRMIVVAGLSATLPVLLRVVLRRPVGDVLAAVWVVAVAQTAHVFLARATHSLAYLLAERETLLAERKGIATRARERREARDRQAREREDSPAVLAVPRLFQPAKSALIDAKEDAGWEALVERVRSSLSAQCEPVGVEATVSAELKGLAPPSSRLRQSVLKIAQEAAANALRDTAPRSVAITLRRADGGLILEVIDDGDEGDASRSKRSITALKGRVVSLGGSAELRRADAGWMVRVKIPCDQLN